MAKNKLIIVLFLLVISLCPIVLAAKYQEAYIKSYTQYPYASYTRIHYNDDGSTYVYHSRQTSYSGYYRTAYYEGRYDDERYYNNKYYDDRYYDDRYYSGNTKKTGYEYSDTYRYRSYFFTERKHGGDIRTYDSRDVGTGIRYVSDYSDRYVS